MRFRLHYITLFIFFAAWSFAQDILVKKDSTKISCRVYKIRSKTIRYIESNDPKERKHMIDKNEISKIIFRNGDQLKYNPPLGKYSTDTSLTISIKEIINSKNKSLKKLTDFVKFNLEAGFSVYQSNISRPDERDTSGTNGSVRFSYAEANKQYKIGFNPGFNFLFGSSPYIKHIFGANFLRTNAEFNYKKTVLNPDSTDSYNKTSFSNLNIKSTDYYLNIVNGIRITFFKSLHIETCVTFNIPTLNRSRISGNTITRETGKPDSYYSIKDSVSSKPHILISYAINPRIIYEFKKNEQRFGVYIGYNLNTNYKLSWFAGGITYYPFKKLK